MPKIVYSRTLEHADWNTSVVREVVAEEVEALKAQPGGDLMLGGADLGATFIRLGLVDEYRIYVHPVAIRLAIRLAIGAGKPLFRLSAEDGKLDSSLVETRTFGNGVALLRYHPVSV